MYHQLTSEQRSQIFVLLQKKTSRKEMAALTGTSESTLSRELRRNSTALGHYLWKTAEAKAMERRRTCHGQQSQGPGHRVGGADLSEGHAVVAQADIGLHGAQRQAHIARAHLPPHKGRRQRRAPVQLPPQAEIQPPRQTRQDDKGQGTSRSARASTCVRLKPTARASATGRWTQSWAGTAREPYSH
jgi:hypothetical protein